MDSLVGLDGTNVALKPLSLEAPTLQKITALECEKLKAPKLDSEIQVDVLESASFTTECEDMHSKGSELCPPTPSLDSEAVETSSASDETEDSEMLSASQTPRGNLFDPFAPGSDEKVFAPNPKKKIMLETKISLRRRLVFDLISDSEDETMPTLLDKEEDSLLESICHSFLELIVLNQVKEISNEYLTEEDNSSDVTEEDNLSEGTKDGNSSEGTKEDDSAEGWKTPTSLPFLTGIADTCPAAPARPALKLRRLDHTICRKLEFGSNMI